MYYIYIVYIVHISIYTVLYIHSMPVCGFNLLISEMHLFSFIHFQWTYF